MFWSYLIPIVNSTALLTAVTLVIATSAYRIYNRQKKDNKHDAAKILLLEIEGAERQLERVSPDKPFSNINEPDVFVMPTASWDKYKYLFVTDFDRNEWDKITGFYVRCRAYDDAVRLNRLYFDKNQQEIRVNLQRILATYADTYATAMATASTDAERNPLTASYVAKRKAIETTMTGVGQPDFVTTYMPMKSENDAKAALRNVEGSLSLTSVGSKLKKLSSDSRKGKH